MTLKVFCSKLIMLKVILLKAQSHLLKVENAQSHFAQSSKSESWPSRFYAGLLENLFRGNRNFLFNNHACQASDVLSAIFPHVAVRASPPGGR
jgi:hypothetical protein